MALRIGTIAVALALGACSEGGGSSSGSVSIPIASPTPSPTPTPTPSPSPTPSPTPSPPAGAAAYITFGEVYTNRVGRDLVLPSGCSGFVLRGQPFEILPVTAFGRGLTLRFVLTPQVWAISGDGVAMSFDGRTADIPVGNEEVAYRQTLPTHVDRFAIERPAATGIGLTYARVATVATRVGGDDRRYACLTGIATLLDDLPVSASGGYPRTTVTGTARVVEGSTSALYTLTSNVSSIATDIAAGRVTIAFTLTGTPSGGTGASVALGTFTASASVDPAIGNFTGALASSDRAVTGAVSGRWFGPQGAEIGGTIGGSVSATSGRPAYSFAGAIFGAR